MSAYCGARYLRAAARQPQDRKVACHDPCGEREYVHATVSGKRAIGKLGWIQTDCNDPERVAGFWGAVFGVGVESRLGDPPQFVNLSPVAVGMLRVCFQRVPERKTLKNRMHFDVWVADVEVACSEVEALGAKRRDADDFHQYGYSWRLMADPEGHEFCLVYDTPTP